eukprot:GCRY01007536.1.p1 GENE.GCRY01007536.1~~GCRY01007536.1.p1  ORF type:complete len:188 (+),score=16.63 GCRY01007536.1:27-566(+)
MDTHLRNEHGNEVQFVQETVREKPAKGTLDVMFATQNAQTAENALIEWVCKDMLPLDIVESPYLIKFVHLLNPNYKMPKKGTLKKKIQDEHARMQTQLKEDLLHEGSAGVHLTTDGWTSIAQEDYVAVKAHYITPNFEMKNVTLNVTNLGERHTATNLAKVLKQDISKFEMAEKVCLLS